MNQADFDQAVLLAAMMAIPEPPLSVAGGVGVAVGGYTFFVDADGSLKIRAPDGSLTPLVVKT